jgi:TctA family transporter
MGPAYFPTILASLLAALGTASVIRSFIRAGLGPVTTIVMLLPATFSLPPVLSLIMLAGIYYRAQYGGSATAILVNLPGESSSVVTAIDVYQMARNGHAGEALATARSAPSSPARSPSCCSPWSHRGWPASRSSSARLSISRYW